MKKFLVISLLLGSQLSYAAQEQTDIATQNIAAITEYALGTTMTSVGMHLIVSSDKPCDGKSSFDLYFFQKLSGVMLVTCGSVLVSDSFLKPIYAKKEAELLQKIKRLELGTKIQK